MNQSFLSRETFCHIFPCGRRLVLKLDATVDETRFLFEWFPTLVAKQELMCLSFEYGVWMGYWLQRFQSEGMCPQKLLLWQSSCRIEFGMRMVSLI